MTALDLLKINWNCMQDRPSVNYPYRAPIIASRIIENEHGIAFNAKVLTNRTRSRWWLEVESNHWLRVYLTTTSTRKRDLWLSAFKVTP